MSKYDQLVSTIIKNIGGKENVIDVNHCVTRLRFHLKDESKASDEALKSTDGIITVMHSAGQYQVVIGNTVGEVYEVLTDRLGIAGKAAAEEKKLSFKDRVIDLITSIFMPSITILCACGMIKGLNTILNAVGCYSADSGIYNLINAIGDSIFYFFPIVIGYNAAKKFKLNPYIGLMIGAALCYPTINGVDMNVFGIALNVSYTSTVLPVILTVALAAPLSRWLDRVIPEIVRSFLSPMITLLVSVILGFVIIGPVANTISGWISSAVLYVYNLSPVFAGLLVGGFWQVLVVFGLHMTFIVLCINTLANGTPDPILALQVFVAFAQAATVLAIMIKTKNKKLKEISFPAFISAIFGVTEPAIYGVTLSRMKMFVISCIGGALSGAYAAATGLMYQQMAGLGLFEIPALLPAGNVGPTLTNAVIATAIAFGTSFILAMAMYKDGPEEMNESENQPETKENQVKNETIASPVTGSLMKLEEVEDGAFAQGSLGKGIAVIPSEGKVFAPFDGTIAVMFPTGHAVGIISDTGCNVLVHIGMNTVELNGKYFQAHVKQGDRVKRGDLLVEFDIDKIKEAGFSVVTPIVVTNTGDYTDVVEENGKEVTAGETLLYAIH